MSREANEQLTQQNELQKVEIDRLKQQLAILISKKDYVLFGLSGTWSCRGYQE
jgi:hypothetical protein